LEKGDMIILTNKRGYTNFPTISDRYEKARFLGRISEKKRIPSVKPQAKINKLFDPPPSTFSAKPPTRVAPKVFAIVFKLSIAELVSSISS
jgi:hypothetical protein